MGSEVWVDKMLLNGIISSSGICCSCNLKYQREEASYITTLAFINLVTQICFECKNRNEIIKSKTTAHNAKASDLYS
jgi:hypothetical protein